MKRSNGLWVAVGGAAALLGWLYLRQRKSAPATRLPNQSIYHFYAPVYDAVFGPTYAGARRRTVELLNLQPGERLLISGVGTGLDLPLIPAGVQVTGVDISAEMLLQARQKTSPAVVELMTMDAQQLDFAEGSFDAALLNLIVSVAPDGHAVFAQAWRVLKPGGRLVLFDKFAPESGGLSPLRRAAGAFFRWIGTDVNRRLGDILADTPDLQMELNDPGLFFGQYRIVRLRKPD